MFYCFMFSALYKIFRQDFVAIANISNELNFSTVYRSVNYFGWLAKLYEPLRGKFTLHATQCSLHFDKLQKNEIHPLTEHHRFGPFSLLRNIIMKIGTSSSQFKAALRELPVSKRQDNPLCLKVTLSVKDILPFFAPPPLRWGETLRKVHLNFNGSSTGVSFTLAASSSFLSPQEIISREFSMIFFFILKTVYCVFIRIASMRRF